jgi:hypothetical protein
MMEGKIRHYTWKDIRALIIKDCGLKPDQERSHAEMWLKGGFQEPEHDNDTILSVEVYSTPYSDRLKKHAGS